MKTTATLLILFALFSPNTFAQDYTQWSLPKGATARLGKGSITGNIVYSPDGTRLAVASSIGIWMYDTQTYREIALFTGHTDLVESVAFSPDGKTVASGSGFGGKVRLWAVMTGEQTRALTLPTSGFDSIAFRPGGKMVAGWTAEFALKNDNAVRLWDIMEGKLKGKFTGHTDSITSVAFSPDGRTLASGSRDQTVRLWDIVAGEQKRILIGHTSEVRSVAFSPDGRTLASGSGLHGKDTAVWLWDVVTGEQKQMLTGHTSKLKSIVFSPDGRTLASGSGFGGKVRLWDAATGEHKRTLTGHTGAVFVIAFSPDGRTLASGSGNETMKLWDIVTGAHKRTLTGHTELVNSVTFSPDGRTLASGGWDKTVRLWDAVTGEHKRTLIGHTSGVLGIAFSPDGRTLASGSGKGTVRLWDTVTSEHKRTLTGHTAEVDSVTFSPDGRTLASGSSDGTVLLWKIFSLPVVTLPKTDADQIYDNAIRAVMWIVNPGIGEGSGVLFDKQFKLAATNAHVTDTSQVVDVYFPAPDENGKLIKERDFYVRSRGVLKRLGYYTKGYVVAKNVETDLAIIKLDGLPETARQIDWGFTTPTIDTGELIYILGNPGGRDLWHWKLGQFQGDYGKALHLQSDVFGGNSGGPVLNRQGLLLGIIARSDRHMNAAAIPAKYIHRLLFESNVKHSGSRR